jgi:hypothetical protein
MTTLALIDPTMLNEATLLHAVLPDLGTTPLSELAPTHMGEANYLLGVVTGGEEHILSFQLTDGGPNQEVLKVNKLLDSRGDPYGTLDWWTGPNVWLSEVPRNLLETSREGELLKAAQAELDLP